tara:strand:+ start:9865 stop:10287 length:423 start_codon:yes stop_codon:yes gene_type:complete
MFLAGAVVRRLGLRALGGAARRGAARAAAAAKRGAAAARRRAARRGATRAAARRAGKPPGLFKQSLYQAGALTAVDYSLRKMLGDDQQAGFTFPAGYGEQGGEEAEAVRPTGRPSDYKGLAGSRVRVGEMVGDIKYPLAQ